MSIRFLSCTVIVVAVLFLMRCKSNDPGPNLPPEPFTVSAKLAPTGPDLILSWSKAKDPNGDLVTYTVVWKDTLIRGIYDTTYTLRKVGYNTIVAGSIIASDKQKASTAAPFSFTVSSEPFLKIPDPNFEQALIDLTIDTTLDGRLRGADAYKVTALSLVNKGIRNLQGIEGFTNLKTLDCSFNSLTSLKLSQNLTLTTVRCVGNQLISLDISQNTALQELDCSTNQLTVLNLSPNKALRTLGVSKNLLAQIDLSQNKKLTQLHCTDNKLVSLSISQNASLTTLWCFHNALTYLDVRYNPVLQVLQCFGNNLPSICVADLSKVTPDWAKDATTTYQVCK